MHETSEILIVFHDSSAAFLDRFQTSPIASAAINHNLLQLASVLRTPNDIYEPPFLYCTIEECERVIGAAIYASPDGLVVSEVPIYALQVLAAKLAEVLAAPSRIIGEPKVAAEAANYFMKLKGTRLQQSTSWYVSHLTKIVAPNPPAPGLLRSAKPGDRELVTSWGSDYGKEKSAFLDVAKFMSNKLEAGELYVWEDVVPTAIVTVSGQTKTSARISSVYTPPRHRGYGYATSAVAAICEKLMRLGLKNILLTWRVGDPAGRIYQRLGFQVIGMQRSYINRARKIA